MNRLGRPYTKLNNSVKDKYCLYYIYIYKIYKNYNKLMNKTKKKSRLIDIENKLIITSSWGGKIYEWVSGRYKLLIERKATRMCFTTW